MEVQQEQIVSYVYGKTGLSKSAIRLLLTLQGPVLTYLTTQLNILVERLTAEKNRVIFDSVRGSVGTKRIEQALAGLDSALAKIDKIYKINPFWNAIPSRIPWSDVIQSNEDLAQIMDLIKQYTAKIPGIEFGSLGVPGLKGIQSYDDLKRRRDELAFRLNQLTSMATYAGIASSKLDTYIKYAQQWLNSIQYIRGYSPGAYWFSGSILLGETVDSISWTDGILNIQDTEYSITESSITFEAAGTYYLYYDRDGRSDLFTATTGELLSSSGDNYRIAQIIVDLKSAPLIERYGLTNYVR